MLGKILFCVFDIVCEMIWVYIVLIVICVIVYIVMGMSGFDVIVLVMFICLIGGFFNYDSSFGFYLGLLEYVVVFFMFMVLILFICMV